MATKSQIKHGLELVNELINDFDNHWEQTNQGRSAKIEALKTLKKYTNKLDKGFNPFATK